MAELPEGRDDMGVKEIRETQDYSEYDDMDDEDLESTRYDLLRQADGYHNDDSFGRVEYIGKILDSRIDERYDKLINESDYQATSWIDDDIDYKKSDLIVIRDDAKNRVLGKINDYLRIGNFTEGGLLVNLQRT